MKIKQVILLIGFVLLMSSISMTPFLVNADNSSNQIAWWNESWSFRNKFILYNSNSNDLTNFQVKLVLNSSNIGEGFDWSKDENSIRFTYYNSSSNTESEIPYWIENYNATIKQAIVWVKVPYLPTAKNTTVYLYYDNPSVSSESDGNDVFDFFDDFNGNSLDTNKWGVTSAPDTSVSNGVLRVNKGSVYTNAIVGSTPQNYVFEAKAKYYTFANYYSGLDICHSQNDQGENGNKAPLVFLMTASGSNISRMYGADGTTDTYNIVSGAYLYQGLLVNHYYIMGFYFNQSSTLNFFLDEPNYTKLSEYSYPGTWDTSYYLFLGHFLGSNAGTTDINDIGVDWVRVRKYAQKPITYQSVSVQDDFSEWEYKQPIIIKNSNSINLSDYPVKIVLDGSTIGNGFNWSSYENSIRFVYYNQTTQQNTFLGYWIQEYNISTKKMVAWVKVPYLPTNENTTIYLYYHNPGVSSSSNGVSVFSFFDDFSKNRSLEYSEVGDAIVDYDVADSELKMYHGSEFSFYYPTNFVPPSFFVAEARVHQEGDTSYWAIPGIGYRIGNDTNYFLIRDRFPSAPGYSPLWFKNIDGTLTTLNSSNDSRDIHVPLFIEARVNGDNQSVRVWSADGTTDTSFSGVYSGLENNHIVGLQGRSQVDNTFVCFDWWFVRKGAPIEPSVGFGKEEFVNQPPNQPTLISPLNNSNNNNLTITLSVLVTDNDSTVLNVSFWDNTSGVPSRISDDLIVNNDSVVQTTFGGLYSGTTHKWFVKVFDGHHFVYSKNFVFTTKFFKGKVTTSDGNAVPNAKVLVINQSSNNILSVLNSDSNGDWSYSVPAGTYLVVAYDPNNSSLDADASAFVSIS